MSNNREKLVKDIRRRTRKKYSSEEKIRIVLEGMRGEESIAELCHREGLNQNLKWSTNTRHRVKAVNCQNEVNDDDTKTNKTEVYRRLQTRCGSPGY
jgi:transposase